MKIIANIATLKKALARAASVAKRSVVADYENVVMSVIDGVLQLTTTDGVMTIDIRVPDVTVLKPGLVSTPVSKFNAVVQSLVDGELTIYTSDNQLTLKTTGFKCLLDFAAIHAANNIRNGYEATSELQVKGSDLKQGLRSVIEAVGSPKVLNEIFTGVLFEASADCQELTLSATDRILVLQSEVPAVIQGDAPTIRMIVPPKPLNVAIQAFDDKDEVVVSYGDNRAMMSGGDVSICTMLIPGEAAAVSKALALREKCQYRAVINREELISAVKRSSVVVDDDLRYINLLFVQNSVTVESSQANQKNRSQVIQELPCDYSGPEIRIRIGEPYLLDALDAATSDEMLLYLDVERVPLFLSDQPEANWRSMIALSRGPKTSE